jgi:hypothetical protein
MIQKLIKENMTMMKNYNRIAKIVRNALKETKKDKTVLYQVTSGSLQNPQSKYYFSVSSSHQ